MISVSPLGPLGCPALGRANGFTVPAAMPEALRLSGAPQFQWVKPDGGDSYKLSLNSGVSQSRTTTPASPSLPSQNTSATEANTPVYRQWPWRGFAFCSDLGTIGYLLKKPRLARWGWALALPYYAYALIHQPTKAKRQEELLYQATANGLFPFLAAKAGVQAGDSAHQALSAPWRQALLKQGLSAPRVKLVGALLAVLLLTPGVGDPISRWLEARYQKHLRGSAKGFIL